jgi:hypothetical protein
MEYTMSEDNGRLHIRAWGRDTPQMPAQICADLLAEIQRLGVTRILVELTQKIALSTVSQFQMIERMAILGITPLHRIALVHHTPGLFEASDMLHVVASNRGLNVRNFRDVDSAVAWLG